MVALERHKFGFQHKMKADICMEMNTDAIVINAFISTDI